jgi:hypothetical protein
MPAAEINDPNAVLQLWNGIQAIERLQVSNLLFAARRLSSSTTRDSFEDRLLNVTIAADALFLTDGEEVDRADRPSLRAAKWLAADLQDTSEATIANILHQTYALRNRVVHGLSFTSEDISSGTRTASPGDLINAAFSIVALALRKAVDHVLHTGEYYSPWREVTREKVPGESALAQSRAWLKANLPSLEDKYAGSFIAIDADKVVDSDLAFGELSRRISASFGSRPILIIQVDPRDRTPSNISGDSR